MLAVPRQQKRYCGKSIREESGKKKDPHVAVFFSSDGVLEQVSACLWQKSTISRKIIIKFVSISFAGTIKAGIETEAGWSLPETIDRLFQ